MFAQRLLLCVVLLLVPSAARADIYRWDTGEVIPGTEGIEPGPGATLDDMDLQFADLADVNLEGATFQRSNLSNANFRSSKLKYANLDGADLSRSDLTKANLNLATLTDADLTDTTIRGARLQNGITQVQLKSTASYKSGNLQDLRLASVDLSNFSFASQDLTGTSFLYWPFGRATANLADADFTDATVNGVDFRYSLQTVDQLYATASYKAKDLRGIRLRPDDFLGPFDFQDQDLAESWLIGGLRGTNLIGANLSNALVVGDLSGTSLDHVDLSGADLRGTDGVQVMPTTVTRHTIWADGTIRGLNLAADEQLVIREMRDEPPIQVESEWILHEDAALTVAVRGLNDMPLVEFQASIPVVLGGTLKLDVFDYTSCDDCFDRVLGHTFRIFDWSNVQPIGKFQHVVSPFVWDLSRLYSAGEVTLLSFEPLEGDTDADGDVDVEDLNNVRNHFGEAGDHLVGDTALFDGVVDLVDLNHVRNNFGSSTGQQVPELSSFRSSTMLGAISLGVCMLRKWRT